MHEEYQAAIQTVAIYMYIYIYIQNKSGVRQFPETKRDVQLSSIYRI